MEEITKMAYNLEEAAMAIGVSRPTMQQIVRTEGFPAMKAGRRWIIPVSAFREWLDEKAKAS